MPNLICGDCLDKLKELPDNSVDAVVTDPPYGMKYQSGFRKNAHKKILNDDRIDWLSPFIDEAFRVLRSGGAFYCFCSQHNLDVFKQALEKRFTIKNILVWVKNGGALGDLRGAYMRKTEFIFFCTKGRHVLRGKRDIDVVYYPRALATAHPTQKPIDLMAYFVEKSTDAGQTVLDPFMGSGTTGVACAELGREFIGIEKDPEYFEIAKARIVAAKHE